MNFWFRTILAIALSTLVSFSSPTAKELKKNLPIHPPLSRSSIEPLQNHPNGIRVFCTIETRCDLDEFVRKTGVCAFFVIKGRTTRIEEYYGTDTCEKGKNGPYKDYSVASMAKSLTSTLVGQVLAERYHLRTREQFERIMTRKLGSFLTLPHRMKLADGYAKVSMDDLLSMRSNIQWRESGSPWLLSDEVYYQDQVRVPPRKQNLIGFASRYRLARQPPSQFNYSALDVAMAIAVVKDLSPARPPLKQFEKGIWAMIGAAHEASWNVDIDGDPSGPCCFRARVDDLARFGRFALEKGQGKGVPAAWFDLATAQLKDRFDGLDEESDPADPSCELGYGYYWWLRRDRPDYFAFGRFGQFIHVYPEDDVVIVQLSDWRTVPADKHIRCITLKSHDAVVRKLRS
ncbi:serine hydrolase domain-containing protein [Rhizobium leguminosarum]|uniref:Serine hydrolase n=1 Tax=Rhizobium leguminosarum TaxID=384 RepID=A0A7K3VUS5_RHILE|nr:serine hydrolase [Rhizobium leguminosarum]NEK19901.1 serine hydrolase [Rhizobium leguminosarum]